MSADLELFTYGDAEVRAVVVAGVRCAVAADICRVLDIKNVSDAVQRLDEADIATADIRSGGQMRRMVVVTEDGATDLVLDSRKPEARKFRRFLTHVVWPSIRDTGSYNATPIPAAIPSHPEALRGWAEEIERRELAEAHAHAIQPSADAWDRLAELGADYEVDVAAKILSRDSSINIGRNRLYVFMHEQDWIFKGRHNTWKAYQDQVDLDRLKMRPGDEFYDRDRQQYRTSDPTILITSKGLAELRRLLGRSGGQLELVTA